MIACRSHISQFSSPKALFEFLELHTFREFLQVLNVQFTLLAIVKKAFDSLSAISRLSIGGWGTRWRRPG